MPKSSSASCTPCPARCRKSACVHYDAGLELQCDACGETWTAGAGSHLRDHDTHLCDACMKAAVDETTTPSTAKEQA